MALKRNMVDEIVVVRYITNGVGGVWGLYLLLPMLSLGFWDAKVTLVDYLPYLACLAAAIFLPAGPIILAVALAVGSSAPWVQAALLILMSFELALRVVDRRHGEESVTPATIAKNSRFPESVLWAAFLMVLFLVFANIAELTDGFPLLLLPVAFLLAYFCPFYQFTVLEQIRVSDGDFKSKLRPMSAVLCSLVALHLPIMLFGPS